MGLAEELTAALGAAKVLTDTASLDARRRDYWALGAIRDLGEAKTPSPACVIRPRSAADIQAVLAVARARGAPVIPFGLGSGVVGGVVASPNAIVLDLGAMNAIGAIDEENLLATFEAGVRGSDAEAAVAARRLTLGHWPQSIAVSSVGGWVATRASGQASTAYGGIEDIVFSIEAVLPDGTLVTLGRAPRAAAGPDLRALMLGSEGTLGVVTAVTLSLRRAPQARALTAFAAADMGVGFAFQRELVQAGWRPPVLRQYDPRESARQGDATGRALILIVHEGPEALVAAERAAAMALARRLGLERRDDALVAHWLEHRNEVPSWETILARGLVVDTVEVSARWSAIGAIYAEACAAVMALPGARVASAHSSHVYRSGLNLYFTFALAAEGAAAMEAAYLSAWEAIMAATARHGGGLAHHHGIGRVRRAWLASELGAEGVALLRRLKRVLDPDGILNPGVLLPAESGDA